MSIKGVDVADTFIISVNLRKLPKGRLNEELAGIMERLAKQARENSLIAEDAVHPQVEAIRDSKGQHVGTMVR